MARSSSLKVPERRSLPDSAVRTAAVLTALGVAVTACRAAGSPAASTGPVVTPPVTGLIVQLPTGAGSTTVPGPMAALPDVPATRGSSAGPGSPPVTPPAPMEAPASRATGPYTELQDVYERYLYDLSGLDDNLNRSWIAPLAGVTTSRLAQATVRAAGAILASHEHGVGLLRDDRITIQVTGADSAVIIDCQDDIDFYLVSDTTGQPDAIVERGDFVGSAKMVKENGTWHVDVFTTTHYRCTY